MKSSEELMSRLQPVLGLFLLVVFWELAFEMRLVDPVLLPSPAQSFQAFWHGLEEGSLWADLRRTVARTGISFAIALVIAVPLGILLGSSDKVYRALEFPIDFFRSTPASAMFPLFLILFGSGESTKIAVAAFGAALAILFATAYGVMNARKQRQLAARVMGASRLQVLSDVTIWESLPQTFVGMRSGVSLALVIVIVAEMFIGSTDGLGQRILKSQMVFDMPDM
jgi:NitT/TauT family transport system permease protein